VVGVPVVPLDQVSPSLPNCPFLHRCSISPAPAFCWPLAGRADDSTIETTRAKNFHGIRAAMPSTTPYFGKGVPRCFRQTRAAQPGLSARTCPSGAEAQSPTRCGVTALARPGGRGHHESSGWRPGTPTETDDANLLVEMERGHTRTSARLGPALSPSSPTTGRLGPPGRQLVSTTISSSCLMRDTNTVSHPGDRRRGRGCGADRVQPP
jgi:hypothetical protein